RTPRTAQLARSPATLTLFETGPRPPAALAALAAGLGSREAAVCRELTKLHEEVRRGELATLARETAAAAEPRGEIAIVIAPPAEERELAADDLDALLRQAPARASREEGVAEVAASTGHPRRAVYQRALALGREARR